MGKAPDGAAVVGAWPALRESALAHDGKSPTCMQNWRSLWRVQCQGLMPQLGSQRSGGKNASTLRLTRQNLFFLSLGWPHLGDRCLRVLAWRPASEDEANFMELR